MKARHLSVLAGLVILAACTNPQARPTLPGVCTLQPGDGGVSGGQYGTLPPWLHEQFKPAPQAATDAAGVQIYVCP